MTDVVASVSLAALLVLVFAGLAPPSDWPVLRGPYLGQEVPGTTPEVFALAVISTEAAEGCSHVSSDDRFFLFVRARSLRERHWAGLE